MSLGPSPIDVMRDFLNEVEVFLDVTGMGASVLGQKAVGDPSLVKELRAGREPGWKLMARVQDFMRSHLEEQPNQ